MIKMILEREKNKISEDSDIEVEHKYIDFSYLILGVKIREGKNYILDDFTLARLLVFDNNIEIYK